ncbi:MAG: UDP-N-acetylmuramoyl-L-alanyl-D-glutamate--2,6-diaminopimelate ligase [Candidatus Methylumidiphilus sp.]
MMSVTGTPLPLSRLLAGRMDNPVDVLLDVRGLCLDSRTARLGDLFFALAGSQSHGMKYAAAAAASGASAILYDPAGGGADYAAPGLGVPCVPVEKLGQQLGYIADRFFGEPSAHMDVVGITGTNGKTSCSHFLATALGEGKPAAVIGTLGWGVPGVLQPTAHTTPDAIEVHCLLAKLRAKSFANVAMEASSHGLEQGRLNGIRFEGCLFTNLSRDHLDYHLTMEAYLEAKLRLVAWPGLKFIAFNLDDDSASAVMARASSGVVRKIGYTLSERHKPSPGIEIVQAAAIKHGQDGISFDVFFEGGKISLAVPLFGEFNVENLMGVVAVLLAKGFNLQEVAQRVKNVRAVPGRMERFCAAMGATAVVDYAHTPAALEKALASLRHHCRGSLWVVFGCGGDRDCGKRPQMGSIAERLADYVVLTDDNPRSEDGEAIINEIISGCKRSDIIVKRDRRLAIAHAVERLGPDDVLLVAGKGHEETQEIGGVKHPFSDREVVGQLLGLGEGRKTLCA